MKSYLTLSKAMKAKKKPETQGYSQLLCDHKDSKETSKRNCQSKLKEKNGRNNSSSVKLSSGGAR